MAPRDERWIVGQMLGQQLDRDVALEALVERQVDGRHAADSEASFQAVSPCDARGASHCPFPLPIPAPPVVGVDVVPGVEGVVAGVVVVGTGVVVVLVGGAVVVVCVAVV